MLSPPPPPPSPRLRLSLEQLAQGGEAVHMKTFVQASVARTGSAAFSRTVERFASIFDRHFGVSDTGYIYF